MRGENAPGFQDRQREFAAHIRHPQRHAAPLDVEPRRMRVYVDLFFRNISNLLAGTFRVTRELLGEAAWQALVRRYLHEHAATSPYFLHLPQEFLEFLVGIDLASAGLPAFLPELCHYEWVELALDVDDEEIDAPHIDPEGDIVDGRPVWSPVARSLCYRFPVHQIGPGHRPEVAPESPTYVIVYRDRGDRVRFMGSNVVTARLATLIQDAALPTGRAMVEQMASELPDLPPEAVLRGGLETLQRLRLADIIAGASRV